MDGPAEAAALRPLFRCVHSKKPFCPIPWSKIILVKRISALLFQNTHP